VFTPKKQRTIVLEKNPPDLIYFD